MSINTDTTISKTKIAFTEINGGAWVHIIIAGNNINKITQKTPANTKPCINAEGKNSTINNGGP